MYTEMYPNFNYISFNSITDSARIFGDAIEVLQCTAGVVLFQALKYSKPIVGSLINLL